MLVWQITSNYKFKMDRFSGLTLLIKSAELGSFSAVGRQEGRTSAAIGKQVSELEKALGVQLLVRTTRRLALTEAGQKLVNEVRDNVEQIENSLSSVNQQNENLTGSLRVNLAPAFGRQYVIPLMGPFLAAHPNLKLDWQFDNRQVDLIDDKFDAGLAGGFALNDSLIARKLAPLHLVVVASPAYLKACTAPPPKTPDDLRQHKIIAMRSSSTRLIRPWHLKSRHEEATFTPDAQILLDDPDVVKEAALSGFGIGLSGTAHCAPYLERGELVRLLPGWWADLGNLSIYFPSTKLRPAKTRVFVDFLVKEFEKHKIAERLSAVSG